MIEKFKNRIQAGQLLADEIGKNYDNQKGDIVVLALPRGGVPVAFQISQRLRAPLDVFLVRKIGAESNEELAMGAITETAKIFNEDIIRQLGIKQDSIDRVIAKESTELKRRNAKYRKGKPAVDITGRTVILVDDGIATGATMRAAAMSIKMMKPAKLVVAVPVGAPDTLTKLSKEVDHVVCILTPSNLNSIGMWYYNFDQTEDKEVLELLEESEKRYPIPIGNSPEKLQNENVKSVESL